MNSYQCTLLGSNVIARHQLLQGAIGTFPEEDEAYWRVTTLMWALPLTVTLAALFDFFCVIVYMKYGHPWKGILSKVKKSDAKENDHDHAQSRSSNASSDKLSENDDSSELETQSKQEDVG